MIINITSTPTTILSIIIIVHICRKVRGKTISSGTNSSDEACYECHPIGSGGDYQYHVNSNKLDSIPYQVDSNKINSIPVIPIQNLIYAPVSEGSPLSEYSQNNHYSQQPHKNVNKLAGDQMHGQTRVNDNLETDNNVIYRIPEDYIDANNYMKHNNILHTELYGDRGDIKILSQSHSFHPITNQSTSLHPLTNQNSGNSQMQSLPDLTDMTSLRRPVTSISPE